MEKQARRIFQFLLGFRLEEWVKAERALTLFRDFQFLLGFRVKGFADTGTADIFQFLLGFRRGSVAERVTGGVVTFQFLLGFRVGLALLSGCLISKSFNSF